MMFFSLLSTLELPFSSFKCLTDFKLKCKFIWIDEHLNGVVFAHTLEPQYALHREAISRGDFDASKWVNAVY